MNDVTISQQMGLSPVLETDIKALQSQRQLLKTFVSSQLKQAQFGRNSTGEGDYGIIPGTKTRSLFKQGAEKLLRLFRMSNRFTCTERTIDKAGNFALFSYKCEIIYIPTGSVIAESEASANSQEVKFKERYTKVVDKDGKESSVKQETPIYDILNNLMKMAQKRALVSATLLATGASEYFTQDSIDESSLDRPASGGNDEYSNSPPVCHDRPMMVSKYNEAEWYCGTCKKKESRVVTKAPVSPVAPIQPKGDLPPPMVQS